MHGICPTGIGVFPAGDLHLPVISTWAISKDPFYTQQRTLPFQETFVLRGEPYWLFLSPECDGWALCGP